MCGLTMFNQLQSSFGIKREKNETGSWTITKELTMKYITTYCMGQDTWHTFLDILPHYYLRLKYHCNKVSLLRSLGLKNQASNYMI